VCVCYLFTLTTIINIVRIELSSLTKVLGYSYRTTTTTSTTTTTTTTTTTNTTTTTTTTNNNNNNFLVRGISLRFESRSSGKEFPQFFDSPSIIIKFKNSCFLFWGS
jgi:hypothetical protein